MSHRGSKLGRICVVTLLAHFFIHSAALADPRPERGDVPKNAASIVAMLDRVAQKFPGQVLKMELEFDDDAPSTWAFEVKVLSSAGRVLEVKLDAVSLEVLDVEGLADTRRDD